MGSTAVAELVAAAAAGDSAAWDSLVERFAGLVWSIARAHRLGAADAADVSQTTWLRLVEHLGRIRDPERVGAWLATTARNECLAVLRRNGRQVAVGDSSELDLRDAGDTVPPPEVGILTSERDAELRRAFAGLGERCQHLLRVLMADPPPSYAEVSAALGMPIGSIGPIRGRCLEQLRRQLGIMAIRNDAGGSSTV